MMKLTGFCIVLFAVSGLINDYSKRKKADIAMLYDFMPVSYTHLTLPTIYSV